MEEIMARGPNFVYAKEFISKKYGDDVWHRVLKALPVDAAKVWNAPPLAYGSYLFRAFKKMVSTLSKELRLVTDSETAKLYEFIADRSLNRIYKMFFQMANPSFVIKNYPKLWNRFFDSGKVTVPVAEKEHAIITFVLDEIFLDWLPPACLGYSKKAVEMAGGKNLVMEMKNKSQVDKDMWEITYELHWKES